MSHSAQSAIINTSTSYTTVLTFILIIESAPRPSAPHQASAASRAGSAVIPSSSVTQTTQAESQTTVVSFTPSTRPATKQSSTLQPLLTASGVQLTSTLSQDASSSVIIGPLATGGSAPSSANSNTSLVVPETSKTSSSVETLKSAGVQSSAASQTPSSPSQTSMADPNANNNIPTAIVASAPPATGTVSPTTYASNLAQANALNDEFTNLTSSSSCSVGQYSCIDAEYAACTDEGKWDVTGCENGEVCAAMPLNTTSGVQIGCFAKSKVVNVLGSVPGQSSSVGSNTSEAGSTAEATGSSSIATGSGKGATSSVENGNGGAVTVTVPSSTAYVTIAASSSDDHEKSSTLSETSSTLSVGNGANAVTVTVPSSTVYQTVTPTVDSSTTQSTSTKSTKPEKSPAEPSSTTTTTAEESFTIESTKTTTKSPEPEQINTEAASTTTTTAAAAEQQQHHQGGGHASTTTISTTPAAAAAAATTTTYPAPASSDDDPLVVIPVTRHSTTTSQAAPAPTDEGNGRNANDGGDGSSAAGQGFIGAEGGTTTSTSIEGVTTSIFITVTSISTVVERETVTVGLMTTTVSVV